MPLSKSIAVFFWSVVLAITSWACSESNFAGSTGKRQSSASLNGQPDAGDGADTGGGLDDGANDDGGADEDSTGTNSGGNSNSGNGNGNGSNSESGEDEDDGDDGADNDDDIDTDEESNSLETREDGKISISKHEDKFAAKFRYETDGGWSDWISATNSSYPMLCHKFKDTVLEMEVAGGKQMKGPISPPHADIRITSNGSKISVMVEDGGCAFGGGCTPDDFIFTLSCPSTDIVMDGVF